MSRESKPERNELEAMVAAMNQGNELTKAILRRMQERLCTEADFHRLLSEQTGPGLIDRLIDDVRVERTVYTSTLTRWHKAFTAKDLEGKILLHPASLKSWRDWSGKGSQPLDQLRGLAYTQPPTFSGMLKWCQHGFTVNKARELGPKMVERYAPMGYHVASALDAISAAISMYARDKCAPFAFLALGSVYVAMDGDDVYLVIHSQDNDLPRLGLAAINPDEKIERDLDVLYVKNVPRRPIFV